MIIRELYLDTDRTMYEITFGDDEWYEQTKNYFRPLSEVEVHQPDISPHVRTIIDECEKYSSAKKAAYCALQEMEKTDISDDIFLKERELFKEDIEMAYKSRFAIVKALVKQMDYKHPDSSTN